ncbi:MAG: DNA starvation/stationary phase protection protein Dps [Acidobacteria bacterium]|nr:DNA starvation/stationary phase protection protein Dps [Acidobacteriota bacterium]
MTATEKLQLNLTKNDLPEDVRLDMITLLQGALADALDLRMQSKQAHWNVKGPSFIALHELFDTASDEAATYSDDLAERLVQLGGVADGTAQTVARTTTLPKYSTEIRSGKEHVDAYAAALSTFGKRVRQSIDKADAAGDKDTADLFTGISRGVDKMLWFVEAHNQ